MLLKNSLCGGRRNIVQRFRSSFSKSQSDGNTEEVQIETDENSTTSDESDTPRDSEAEETRHERKQSIYSTWMQKLHKMRHSIGHHVNGTRDLHRFLQQVGTNAKEARYWLKSFQQLSENSPENSNPFAVIQIDPDVFNNLDMLENLASSIAFLHRHDMHCVLVHGHFNHSTNLSQERLQHLRNEMQTQAKILVGALEAQGANARPFFSGSGILQAHPMQEESLHGELEEINEDMIKWAMQTHHIPILPGLGETSSGQMLALDIYDVTSAVSSMMQPLKVLLVNTQGGLVSDTNQVIPNISLPFDPKDSESQNWCTDEVKNQMMYVTTLLRSLREESSVVITSACTLLNELFTHNGTGTLFKIPERIHRSNKLEDIDREKLQNLLARSFRKPLKADYFDKLAERIHTVYYSEFYNAAAIITKESNFDVPYLDKFAVSRAKQSEGLANVLMKRIKQDFPHMFWRSRRVNKRANQWYFGNCEGFQANGEWYIFWYGVHSHVTSNDLMQHSLALPDCFASQDVSQSSTQPGSSESSIVSSSSSSGSSSSVVSSIQSSIHSSSTM